MNRSEVVQALTASSQLSRAHASQLERVLEDFLKALEQGQEPDREKLIRDYPDLAESLRDNLAKLETLHRAALGLGEGHAALEQSFGLLGQLPGEGELGDFRLIRELGRGGMGVVYEAKQISLGRRVALKVLPFASMLDKRQLQRFKLEAQAAAMLKHPHIVSVYSVGHDRGVHYYAMELIEGQSLAEVIEGMRVDRTEQSARSAAAARNDTGVGKRPQSDQGLPAKVPTSQTSIPSPQCEVDTVAALSTQRMGNSREYFRTVARLGIQAADALEYAHQQGVIHRDIKPSNLLLDDEEELWITDFGLAQIQTDQTLTISGDLLGTLRYMSPEQAAGKQVFDQRTDVYSLGITLYELITLAPAFAGDDRQALLRDVTEGHPRSLRQVNSSIPRDLETVIHKAISREIDGRYESARNLADDLKRFLDQRPIIARRASRGQHVWRWACRNPLVATLTSSLVCLLLVLAVSGTLAAIKQTRHAEEMAELANSESQARNVAERASSDLRGRNYVLAMNTAYQAYYEANIPRVRRLLSEHVPASDAEDLRGFEWHHLATEIAKIDAVPTIEQEASVLAIALSPDGRVLASGSADGSVNLWDLRRSPPSLLSCLSGHAKEVTSVAFSPDGKTLAVGSGDRSVILWDIKTHISLKTFRFSRSIRCVAFSPDGRFLAIGGSGFTNNLRLIDLETGDVQRLSGHRDMVASVDFSPDSATLASAGVGHKVILWNVESGEHRLLQHQHTVFSVRFSPDGKTLAAGGHNYETRIWDTESWQMRISLRQQPHSVASLAFSPDGRTLVTGGLDRTVRLWDLATGRILATLRGHLSEVNAVEFSEDGTMVVSCSDDRTIRLWSVASRCPVGASAQGGSWRTPMAISPDGRFLVAGSSFWRNSDRTAGGSRLFELSTGNKHVLADEDIQVRTVAFSPVRKSSSVPIITVTGGKQISSGSGEVRFWNGETGERLDGLDIRLAEPVKSLDFSPDGQVLAIAGQSDLLYFWDVDKRVVRSRTTESDMSGFALSFSPDGARLAAGSGDVKTGVVTSEVEQWDVATGQSFPSLRGHNGVIMDLDYSANGALLASASLDGTARVWDVLDGTEVHALSGHPHWVVSVAFSPDGKSLATGSTDGTVKLWQMATGEEVAVLKGHIGVMSVEFSPDGTTLAASYSDGSIRLWHADVEKNSWPVTLR